MSVANPLSSGAEVELEIEKNSLKDPSVNVSNKPCINMLNSPTNKELKMNEDKTEIKPKAIEITSKPENKSCIKMVNNENKAENSKVKLTQNTNLINEINSLKSLCLDTTDLPTENYEPTKTNNQNLSSQVKKARPLMENSNLQNEIDSLKGLVFVDTQNSRIECDNKCDNIQIDDSIQNDSLKAPDLEVSIREDEKQESKAKIHIEDSFQEEILKEY